MFEKLVESTTQKKNGRTGRLFLVTGIVYAVVLTAVGVTTIFWFNPALAESNSLTAILVPPPPPGTPPPPKTASAPKPQVASNIFVVPKETIDLKAIPKEMPRLTKAEFNHPGVAGADFGPITGLKDGVPGSNSDGDFVPPPPPVKKPTPNPEPEPKPTPAQAKMIRTTSVLQGSAIRRVQPPYPPIAKAAHVQGAVQVQIEISEQGQVISAVVLSGHPLLRDASAQAARQWLWKPTLLSDVPVKVQGVLTFNFKLD